MGAPQIPKTQQDALPLVTVGDAIAQAADTVTIIGNTIIKKWGPAATGINGPSSNVADPTTAGQVYLLSNWLDFSGMTRFTVALGTRIPVGVGNSASGNITQAWNLRVIPAGTGAGGLFPIEPVPFPPGPNRHNLLGTPGASMFPIVGIVTIPAIPALVDGDLPLDQVAVCGWQVGSRDTANGTNLGVMGSARLWFGLNVGCDPRFNFVSVIAQA